MEVSLTSIFLNKFQTIVGSCYEKKCMIDRGEIERAISEKPSGVWYSNDYAEALYALGDTPIVINLKGDKVAARALYTSMKTNDFFYTFMASNKFWQVPFSESSFLNKKFNVLQMKRGVSPSEAYEKLASGLSFMDCASIIDLALGLALIEKYGKSKFDEVMRAQNSTRIGGSEDPFLSRCFKKPKKVMPLLPELKFSSPIPVGSVYYLSNHHTYQSKHPHGTAKGMNLVCTGLDDEGQPLFTGLGLNPVGVKINEVVLMLIDEFNKKPIEESLLLTDAGIKSFHDTDEKISFPHNGLMYSGTFDQIKKMQAGVIKSSISTPTLMELYKEVLNRESLAAAASEATLVEEDFLSSMEAFSEGSYFQFSINEEYLNTIFSS